jgi:hypothetical protein
MSGPLLSGPEHDRRCFAFCTVSDGLSRTAYALANGGRLGCDVAVNAILSAPRR